MKVSLRYRSGKNKGYSKGKKPPKEDSKLTEYVHTSLRKARCSRRLKRKQQQNVNNLKETAYVSQEEVSEESAKEVAETETSLLTFGQFQKDYQSMIR